MKKVKTIVLSMFDLSTRQEKQVKKQVKRRIRNEKRTSKKSYETK